MSPLVEKKKIYRAQLRGGMYVVAPRASSVAGGEAIRIFLRGVGNEAWGAHAVKQVAPRKKKSGAKKRKHSRHAVRP